MPLRLRPSDARFGDLLAQLASSLVDGAQLLAELLGGDRQSRVVIAGKIREVDQAAESTLHALLRLVAASFVTPLDRIDLFRVGWAMRTCTARMDAVADEIVLFRLGELPTETAQCVQLVVRAADVTAVAIPRLARPRTLADPWLELTRLGKQAGQAHRRLLAEVTTTTSDPAALVHLSSVAQSLRRVVEAFEDVATALQTVVVKEG